MLNIEREPLTFTFGRADHDDGRPSGKGIAQFIPDVWVVGRNVCQADAGIANPLLDSVDWNVDMHVLIDTIWFEPSGHYGGFEDLLETLIELAVVERLDHKATWHIGDCSGLLVRAVFT